MRKVFLLSLMMCLLRGNTFAQTENTFSVMENVFQSSYFNVSHIPNYRLSVTLPGLGGLSTGLINNGFDLRSISRREADTLVIDGQKLVSGLAKNNQIGFNFSTDLIAIRFKARKTFLSFNVSDRMFFRYNYPKEFMELLWYGNTRYLGQSLEINNLGIRASIYREFGLSAAHEFGKLSLGARVKLLQGFANVHTATSKANLFTSNSFDQLELNSELLINTSGYNEEIYKDFQEGNNNKIEQRSRDILTDFSNRGFGLDAAATYRLNKKLSFSGGFNNLGSIRWTRDVTNYESKGVVDFRGVELDKLITDSSGIDFENYGDSIADRFKFTETKKAYRSPLLANYFASAAWNITPSTRVTGMLYLEYFYGFRPATTIAVQQKIKRWFDFVVSWSTQYRQYDMVGVALMVKPGPLQIFIAGDNILGAIDPFGLRSFNLRLGTNLVFGRIKSQDQLPKPDKL